MLSKILPEKIWGIIDRKVNLKAVNEIRFRVDKPIVICVSGKNYFLSENGATSNLSSALYSSKIAIEDIIPNEDIIVQSVKGKLPDAPALSFERRYPNGCLFEPDTRRRLEYMAKAAPSVENSADAILNEFRLFTRQHTEARFDVFYALTVLFSRLKLTRSQAQEYTDLALEIGVLDKTFSSFDCDDPGDMINQMRAEFIDSLAHSGFYGLQNLAQKMDSDLLLCAEVVHRVYPNLTSIGTSVMMSHAFINIISTFSVRLHKLIQITDVETEKTIIRSTRTCVLKLLIYAFSIPEVADAWFSLPLFNKSLLYFLTENSVRHFVLTSYHDFMVNRPMISAAITTSILEDFDFLVSKFPGNGYVQIATELLHMLNSVFDEKFGVFRCMEDIYRKALRALSKLSGLGESGNFFIETMYLSRKRILNQEQMLLVKQVTETLKGRAPLTDIRKGLFFLLGQGDPDSDTFFYMRQREVFRFLIDACENVVELELVFNDLSKLTDGSLYNCEQVFLGGIDKVMLDVLVLLKHDESKDGITLQILRILERISTHFCARDRVMKYIELISSMSTGCVSVHQASYILTLTHIFQKIADLPRTSIPCHEEVVVSQIPTSVFRQPFQITFWYFAEPYLTTEPRQICSLTNSKSKGFHISVTSSQLIVTSKRKVESVVAFDVEFSVGKWAIFDVNFLVSSEGTEVAVRFGNTLSAAVVFPLKLWEDESITMTLGDGLAHCKPLGHIAAVSVYKGTDRHAGVWRSGRLAGIGNPELSVSFERSSQLVAPVCNFPVAFAHKPPKLIKNFVDVVIEDLKVSSLLLPFTQIDQKTVMGSAINDVNDLVVDVFVIFFQIGERAQTAFYEEKCVDVIAHLLSNGKSNSISFSLYHHFCALLSSVTHEDLKMALLKKVILNYNIWGRAPDKAPALITNHWYKSIFAEFRSQAEDVWSLPALLQMMSYKVTDKQTAKNLASLAVTLAGIRFTCNDLLAIVGFCVHCADLERVKIGLNMLIVIATECELSSEVKNGAECITLLHHLMEHKNEDTFIEMIKVIVTFHQRHILTSFPMSLHFDMLLPRVKPRHCTVSILDRLLAIANQNVPTLYPLCCMIAIRIDQQQIDRTVQEVTAKSLLECSPMGSLWIVGIFLLADVASSHKLVHLVCENDFSGFENIFLAVFVLCAAGRRDPGDHLVPFLSLAIAALSDRADKRDTCQPRQFLDIAYRVMLFRPRVHPSRFIMSLFEESPFHISRKVEDNLRNCLQQPQLLFRRLKTITTSNWKLQFGLRFDKHGNWMDASLALQCLNLFEMTFDKTLLRYDLLITGFLARVRTNAAINHIQRINAQRFIADIPGMQDFLLSSSKGKISFRDGQRPSSHLRKVSWA